MDTKETSNQPPGEAGRGHDHEGSTVQPPQCDHWGLGGIRIESNRIEVKPTASRL